MSIEAAQTTLLAGIFLAILVFLVFILYLGETTVSQFGGLGGTLQAALTNAFGAFSGIAQYLLTTMQDFASYVVQSFQSIYSSVAGFLSGPASNVVTALAQELDSIVSTVGRVTLRLATQISTFLIQVVFAVPSTFLSASNAITGLAFNVQELVANLISRGAGFLFNIISSGITTVTGVLAEVLTTIIGAIETGIQIVIEAVLTGVQYIEEGVEALYSILQTGLADIEDAFNTALSAVEGVVGELESILAGAFCDVCCALPFGGCPNDCCGHGGGCPNCSPSGMTPFQEAVAQYGASSLTARWTFCGKCGIIFYYGPGSQYAANVNNCAGSPGTAPHAPAALAPYTNGGTTYQNVDQYYLYMVNSNPSSTNPNPPPPVYLYCKRCDGLVLVPGGNTCVASSTHANCGWCYDGLAHDTTATSVGGEQDSSGNIITPGPNGFSQYLFGSVNNPAIYVGNVYSCTTCDAQYNLESAVYPKPGPQPATGSYNYCPGTMGNHTQGASQYAEIYGPTPNTLTY